MPATGFQVISILYACTHPVLTAGLGSGYDFSCPVYMEEEVESQEMASHSLNVNYPPCVHVCEHLLHQLAMLFGEL